LLDHGFTGPAFTVGIEEELMLLDPDSLDLAQAIEEVLPNIPPEFEGQVKPELMQSFLEVGTKPCPDVVTAGKELHELRRAVTTVAEDHGLLIAAAATHPFALWEDQEIVQRPRYLQIVEEFQYVVRQFLIFGTHVHVGIEGAERAIFVADGLRRSIPLLLALSTNSPFLRGRLTGMLSSRTPVYRALPRSGVPPHFGNWDTYAGMVDVMTKAGAIEDYTFLWWDVRPHPNLGTVEVRVYDQQTRVDLTVALAAMTVAMAHQLSALFDTGEKMGDFPMALVDDNKIRAAIRGMDGVLLDFWLRKEEPAERIARHVLDDLREHAEELGCERELAGIEELLAGNTGAHRQLRMYEENTDLKALIRELVASSRA
jgi:glutamate---cysteine ligase / carboxylate-amine ligase